MKKSIMALMALSISLVGLSSCSSDRDSKSSYPEKCTRGCKECKKPCECTRPCEKRPYFEDAHRKDAHRKN